MDGKGMGLAARIFSGVQSSPEDGGAVRVTVVPEPPAVSSPLPVPSARATETTAAVIATMSPNPRRRIDECFMPVPNVAPE
jgi:hypothetical protein